MNAAEAAAAMKLLSGLALTYLEGFNAAVEDEERCVGEMQFTSACRFIEARREDAGLTADAIARAIGCSLPSLSRLLEQSGLAVAEHVRAVRSNYSLTLHLDLRLAIAVITTCCGC